jgi:actin-like ATPase involved in cell morphogenesis
MKDGVIADFGVTRTMISYFIRRARTVGPPCGPRAPAS